MTSSRRVFLRGGLAAAGLAGARPVEAAPKPEIRMLGRTGLKTSRLALGTPTLTDLNVIPRALDAGINHVDTSRDYQNGNNERLVGLGIKGRRDKILLGTKTRDVRIPGLPAEPDETVEQAMEELHTSLKDLGTDYLDIWYLHHKDSPEEFTPALLEAAHRAKKQGKARFIGVSTHNLNKIVDWVVQSGEVDVVLTTYNYTMGERQEAAMDKLEKAGLGVVIMKSLAGGPRQNKKVKAENALGAAFRWVLRHPAVDCIVSSLDSFEMIDEDLLAISSRFSPRDGEVLTRRLDEIGPLYCRNCGHCEEACRKEMAIADILRYVMYADGYGQFALGREKYLRLPVAARRGGCGECAECTVECPFGVAIARQLERAAELFA